jgi:UDP-glucose 4-epimerase
VYLSKAIRLLGRAELPLLLPMAQTTANVLRRFGLVDFPTDQLNVIIYGRVVSTARAREALGFRPQWTTEETLLDFRHHRSPDSPAPPSDHPAWERELFDYLKSRRSETV